MLAALCAYAFSFCVLGVVGFQIALILGAPWGHLTQGGQIQGALPPAGRAFAALSIGLQIAMALAVLSQTGHWPMWPRWTGFATVALQALVFVLNVITRSAPERRLWAPITGLMLVLAICSTFR